MKKLSIVAIAALVCTLSFAQAPRTVTKAQLDSLRMALPTFQSGMIMFSDGTRERGALNIDCLTNTVQFVDSDGSVKNLVNNSAVDKVVIGKKLFIRYGVAFIEVESCDSEVILAQAHSITVINSEKNMGMGMTSETTNISTMSGVYSDGKYLAFDNSSDYKIIDKHIPYLYREGKIQPATKRQILKAFPDNKAAIEKYLKENKVDFGDYDQVKALLQACVVNSEGVTF